MTLEQIFKQWHEGQQIEAKLSYREKSSLFILPTGELTLSFGVFTRDLLGDNWEVVSINDMKEC